MFRVDAVCVLWCWVLLCDNVVLVACAVSICLCFLSLCVVLGVLTCGVCLLRVVMLVVIVLPNVVLVGRDGVVVCVDLCVSLGAHL